MPNFQAAKHGLGAEFFKKKKFFSPKLLHPSPQELIEQFHFNRKHRQEWQQFSDLFLVKTHV
jgi:hypothetical protein